MSSLSAALDNHVGRASFASPRCPWTSSASSPCDLKSDALRHGPNDAHIMVDDIFPTVPLLQLRVQILYQSVLFSKCFLGLCLAFAPSLALAGESALHDTSLALSYLPRLVDFLGVSREMLILKLFVVSECATCAKGHRSTRNPSISTSCLSSRFGGQRSHESGMISSYSPGFKPRIANSSCERLLGRSFGHTGQPALGAKPFG